MAFTYIWHQLYLHRQKITFAVLFVLCLAGTAQAQNQKIKGENKPGYDEKRVHYGFYLGAPFSRYMLEHSQLYAGQVDAGITANPEWSVGFTPGLVLNVRLFEYLDARFVPGVSFPRRTIDFQNPSSATETEFGDDVSISPTLLELPVLLKYRAKRRGNFRMYMVGGLKYSKVMGERGDRDTQTGQRLHTERQDIALEYGVGLDIFYPYFKFAPELRFSHGLMNQKANYSNPEYSDMIDRMKTRTVSLIFHFE